MIIKKKALDVIKKIKDKTAVDIKELNNEFIEELNLSGIIKFPTPASVELTYGGLSISL